MPETPAKAPLPPALKRRIRKIRRDIDVKLINARRDPSRIITAIDLTEQQFADMSALARHAGWSRVPDYKGIPVRRADSQWSMRICFQKA